ncbi:CMRF35-like molecule 1 isoform X1 [Pygocentrus nattereri]|uniref:CMRF35-like molecule 1 isoform X1 n=1 Tax=Pygocentrus nattereri TaxID=42514 RepID=UPI0018914D56|nr:CMRF35-like molecule 1 isoform X1 [Pygocentrus nattereri]
MKVPQLLICVVLLVKRYKTSGEEIHGYESSSVSITCSHSWAGSNKKYFCKDPCETNVDILIDSTKKSSGRYRLTDSGTGVFTVEIARLSKEDAGKYWCGVDRVFSDTYNEVILTVLDAPQTSPSPSSSTHLPTTVTSLGNISTSNATFAAVSVSAPAASDQSNNAKTTDWRTYLIVSVCVLLMTSVVWILAFLGLYYNICAHPILESQCCSKSKEFDASDCDGNSFGKQSSVSRSRPPAAEDTEPDYENIFNATTKFPAEPNTYSNQWK